MIIGFFFIHAVEQLAQLLLVVGHFPDELQVLFIVRAWNPKPNVAVCRIFVFEMLHKSLPLLLLALVGVVFKSEQYGASEHCFRLQVAVGLCHNPAVDAPRRVRSRGSVVLNRFFNDVDLLS